MVGKQLLPQTQGFKIRYVKETDFPVILQMVGKVVSKVYPDEQVSKTKIQELFDKALENEIFTGIVLVDPEDTPRGYIFACVTELYFHPRKVATCLSIWVDEECRGHSLDMLRAFDSWAKYKMVDSVVISSFAKLTPEGSEKILSWFGFELKEKQYWKDLT